MCPIHRDFCLRHALRPTPVPDFYMPAMPPLALFDTFRRWRARRRCAQELRALLAHDDRVLHDLGYARAELAGALEQSGPRDNPCHRLLVERQNRHRRWCDRSHHC